MSNYMDIDYNQYHLANAQFRIYMVLVMGMQTHIRFLHGESTFGQDTHSEYFSSGTSIKLCWWKFSNSFIRPTWITDLLLAHLV